jgi:hypothetical protein
MSNRHDEGFGSGFGFGYDPHLDGGFRSRRFLDEDMGGNWNGVGGRGFMTDRFYDRTPYERHFGFTGHPYAAFGNVGPYGHPNAFFNNQFDRTGGYFAHPYDRVAFERNAAFNAGFAGHPSAAFNTGFGVHPYDRAAFERNVAFNTGFGVHPFERNAAFNTGFGGYPYGTGTTGFYGNAFDRQFGFATPFERSIFNNVGSHGFFGTTPWEQQRNAFFGTPNVGLFNTPNVFGMTPWERNAALFGAQHGMFNPNNPFHVANVFGSTLSPWELQRNIALFGTPHINNVFGTTPFEQQRNLALFGTPNLGLINNVFGTTPFEQQRNMALFGTPNVGLINNVFGTTPFEQQRNMALFNAFNTQNQLWNTNVLNNAVLSNAALNNVPVNNALFNTQGIFGTPHVFNTQGIFGTPHVLNTHGIFNTLGTMPFEQQRNIALFGTPFVTPAERMIAERNIALFGTPFVSSGISPSVFGTGWERNAAGLYTNLGDVRNATAFDRHPHDRGFFGQNQSNFGHGFPGGDLNDVNAFGVRSPFGNFGNFNRGFVRGEHDFAGADINNPFVNNPFVNNAAFFGADAGFGFGFGDDRAPFYGRGPKGYKRPDERIREEVAEVIARQGFIDASDVEVNVENGIVRLIGSVAQRRDKRGLEYLVERIHGVEEVRNELRLNHNPSINQFQNRIVDRAAVQPHNGKNARA